MTKLARQMLVWFFILFTVLQNLVYIPVVKGEYIVDENKWELEINFLDNMIWVESKDANVEVDIDNGSVSLSTWASGVITLSEINVKSLKTWWSMWIELDVGSYNNLDVDIYDCNSNILMADANIVWWKINLSSITGYSCIQPIITLNSGTPNPVISKVKFSWAPLSYIGLNVRWAAEVQTCGISTYYVGYSVSYVDDEDVYIWTEINNNGNPALEINPVDVGTYIDHWYLSTETTFTTKKWEEIVVPANSIYRHFDEIKAGESSLLSYTIKSECGLGDGIQYGMQAHSNGVYSEENTSNVKTVELISSPQLRLDKRQQIQ